MNAIALLLALLVFASGATAELAPAKRDELTRGLRVVSDGRRNQDSIRAKAILSSPEHDRADFEDFFGVFFQRDPLTPELSGYLFRVASEQKSEALQEALASILVDQIVSLIGTNLSGPQGPTLHRNSVTFAHLISCMNLLARLTYEGEELSTASRSALYDRLKGLIAAHPKVLRKEVTIDVRAHPKLAAVRAHLYKNLRDFRVPIPRARFIEDTGFHGRYAEILADHDVLVLDNNGLDGRQLRAIQALLSLIPSILHRTSYISQHRMLGNTSRYGVDVRFKGSPGVNIHGHRIEAASGNPFPPDVEAVRVPAFCTVLQHELNHMVDGYTIRGNAALARRREELIAQAGTNPIRYLRSTVGRGYFVRYAQEFFASISNQYFTDSRHTLELALQRLEQGFPQPINQFLFFAEVYSQGGARTLAFEQDEGCNYSRSSVPVGRDEEGRIDRLQWKGTEFHFDLDPQGDVRRVSRRQRNGAAAGGPASP
jgi:hypothetical protein